MEGGRITAQGTHEELLDESALYAEIVDKGMPRLGRRAQRPRRRRARRGRAEARAGGALHEADPTAAEPRGSSGRERRAAPARRGGAAAPVPRPRDRGVGFARAGDGGQPRSALPREARDRRRHHAGRPRCAQPDRGRVRRRRRCCTGARRTCRPTWSGGSGSARCRTCGCASSRTSSASRSASSAAARPAC